MTSSAKFTLALSLPVAILLIGFYKLTMAFAVASESIKYLPSALFHLPDILISLSILIGAVILSLGLTRVMFAFARSAEVRFGYTQLATSNSEDYSVRSIPELSKPIVERNLPDSASERLSERRDISEHRHSSAAQHSDPTHRLAHDLATAHARLASFRAGSKSRRGVIDVESQGISLPRQDVSLYSLDGRD